MAVTVPVVGDAASATGATAVVSELDSFAWVSWGWIRASNASVRGVQNAGVAEQTIEADEEGVRRKVFRFGPSKIIALETRASLRYVRPVDDVWVREEERP